MAVWIVATLDTKGLEAAFLQERLAKAGVRTRLVDAGCLGDPAVRADVTREEVFEAAGTTLAEVRSGGQRGIAVTQAAHGVRALALAALDRGELTGVLGLGGSAGTTIGCEVMRALPLGLPKLMLSTLASGPVRQYVGDKDIVMANSVVDILGLNRISRVVLGNAAAAMVGMVGAEPPDDTDSRPLVAATMFGVTTPCVERARVVLEEAGYEVIVFHATGNGGQAMESLIRDGLFTGVLDVTTTELADELVGGVLSAGPTRLSAAAETGTPQVVSVGATDMVNFLAPGTIPERFAERTFHHHNDNVTLMRTTPEECASIGAEIAEKLASARGPSAIFLPRDGVSAIDCEGQPFDDPDARAKLFEAVRSGAGSTPVETLEHHINSPAFAEAMAHALLRLMETPT